MLSLQYNLPVSAKTIQRVIDSENIADVIKYTARDPAFALKILYFVNSVPFSYYRESVNKQKHSCFDLTNRSCRSELLKRKKIVETIRDGVSLLGIDKVKFLAATSDMFPSQDSFYYSVSKHSYLFGEFIEYLATVYNIRTVIENIELLKTAAVLHDVGKLFIYTASTVFEVNSKNDKHGEIGYKLLSGIGLSELLSCTALCHHSKNNCRCFLSKDELELLIFFRVAHGVFTCDKHIAESEIRLLEKMLDCNIKAVYLSLVDFIKEKTTQLDFLDGLKK